MKCQLISYVFISHVGANSDITNMKNEKNQEGSDPVIGLLSSIGFFDKAVIIEGIHKTFLVL